MNCWPDLPWWQEGGSRWWTLTVKRWRNAKPKSTPKHCTLQEYAYATGLECLFGALYLKGETERVQQLWQQVLEVLA